jgi:hypothetical protein
VLEARAKQDPERFARLASKLPDDAQVAYFDAVLRGVADAETAIPIEETEALIVRCHALPNRPCGRWIARPLHHHVATPLSQETAEILCWYATHDPDPTIDRDASEERSPDERLRQHGLNSVRGGIAYDLTRLIWNNPANTERLMPAVRSLVGDRVAAVRAMAAETLIAILREDSMTALELLDLLIADCSDDLLATHHVYDFLRYRIGVDFDRLRPIIERMIASPVVETQRQGSTLACIAALSVAEAREIADACRTGPVSQRLGAARVYAANLTGTHHRDECETALRELFNDSDKEVRDAAADVVRRFSDSELGDYVDLVEALVGSAAAAENWADILFALTETTAAVPDLALSICSQLLEGSERGGSTIVDVPVHHADSVSQLLVRVYSDGDGDEASRTRALDLIDRSLEQGVYGAHSALADHDRAWLSTA